MTVLEILIRAKDEGSRTFDQFQKAGKAAAVGVTEEMKKLQAQLARMKQAQADFTAEHGKASPRIAEVTQRLKDQVSALGSAGSGADQAGTSLGSFALKSSAASAAVLALGKALFESAQAAVAYEKTLVQIEVLTGTNSSQVREWADELKSMSGQVGKAPQELAEALYSVASAGQTSGAALDIVRLAAQGSAVGMGDTKDIAQALTAVMNSYASTNLKASEAMDVLVATVREGGAEADQLAGSIGRVAGVAASFGISIQEVGAFIATFTRVIPSSAEAVTSLRQTILNLMAPSDETKEALKNLGMSAEGLRISIRDKGLMATLEDLMAKTGGNVEQLDQLIPNVRALAGVMATTGAQGAAYKDILFSIQNAHGDFDKAVERTEETVAARWDKMVAKAKSASLAIGEILIGAATTFDMLMGEGGGVASTLAEPPDPEPWNNFGAVLSKAYDGAADSVGGLAVAQALATQEAQDAATAAERDKEAKEKAGKAADSFAKSLASAVEEMRDGVKNLDVMAAALDAVGGVSGLSAAQIEKYGQQVEKAMLAGATLTKAQLELLAVYKESQWIEAWGDALAASRERAEDASESVFDLAIDANRLADAMGGSLGIALHASDMELVKFIEEMEALQPALKEAELRGMDTSMAQEALATALAEAAGRGVLAGKALKEYEENLRANVSATSLAEEAQLRLAQQIEEVLDTLASIGDIFDSMSSALSQMGIEADSTIGRMVKGFEQLAGAAEDGAKAYAQFASGDVLGGISSGVKAIGGLVGGIKSIFGESAAAKKFREEMERIRKETEKMRADFIASHGGLEALHKKAQQAGTTLAAMFSAKNADELRAAIDGIKDALDFQNEAQERLNSAVEKYGFTIDELGPRFAQQKLDEMAKELYTDYQALVAGGVDVAAIHTRMGESFSEYVQQVIKGGGTIPEAMRGVIEKLIEEGKLVDENGNAYKTLEEANINFAKTQSEMWEEQLNYIKRMVEAIERLAGIKPAPIKVPIEPEWGAGFPSGAGGGNGPRPPKDFPVNAFGGFYERPTLAWMAEAGPAKAGGEFALPKGMLQEMLNTAAAMAVAQHGGGGGTQFFMVDRQVLARSAAYGFATGAAAIPAAAIRGTRGILGGKL